MNESEIEAGNQTYHEAQSLLELMPNFYTWTYGKFAKMLRGDIIELGCGAGLGMRTYIDNVSHVYAVDYNPELLRRIARQYPANRVTTIQTDLRGDWNELNELQADAVIMMDVLEHFSDDAAVLSKAARLVKPGGYVILKVPSPSYLFSDMDRASGHFRRYDPDVLTGLATAAKLKTVFLVPINPIGAIVYKFRNKQKRNFSKSFSPLQLKLINALMPMIALFDVLTILPGLSLVGVFQKPLAH